MITLYMYINLIIPNWMHFTNIKHRISSKWHLTPKIDRVTFLNYRLKLDMRHRA